MLRTKSVYEAAGSEDGFRLLIMRKWPRGIAKSAVDGWEKELGPGPELLKLWLRRQIEWEEFRLRYTKEVETKPALMSWLVDKSRRGTLTLLCGCRDEKSCHRTVLKEIVEEAIHGNERVGVGSIERVL